MGEQGGVQRYIYWSERRIRSILNDQGIRIIERRQRKISTPNIKSFFPTVEWTTEFPSLTRPELSDEIEKAIGQNATSDLHSPAPICYAKGRTNVVFGEFTGGQSNRALMYATQQSPDSKVTAVCLFGSLENYSDFITKSGTTRKTGWTSSAASSIYKFLADEGRITPSVWENHEYMAREAVKIASHQGTSGWVPENVRHVARNRGYTYGETLSDGEWFAEIFLDYDLSNTPRGPQDGHHRILIGAPLWLRTPSIKEIELYAGMETDAIIAPDDQKPRRKWWQSPNG